MFSIVLALCVSSFLIIKGVLFEGETQSVDLYYLNNSGELTAVSKNIPLADDISMVENVLEKLYIVNPKEHLKHTLPNTVELLAVDINNDIASVNFSANYKELTSSEEIVARASIVWSLTSLDYIKGVVIKVENSVLSSKSNRDFGVLNRQNTILNKSVLPKANSEYQIVDLYFANADNTDFAVERRLIEVEANKGEGYEILEQLISGPQEAGNLQTVPKDTKINDIVTTNDGVCYVNLSYEFVSKHSGGSLEELLTIYSIVNSLCQSSDISKVQFLIDGERLNIYKTNEEIDLSKPFEANSIIQ